MVTKLELFSTLGALVHFNLFSPECHSPQFLIGLFSVLIYVIVRSFFFSVSPRLSNVSQFVGNFSCQLATFCNELSKEMRML